jgi:hypothetical protein
MSPRDPSRSSPSWAAVEVPRPAPASSPRPSPAPPRLPSPPRRRAGLAIGVGAVVVIGLGIAAYRFSRPLRSSQRAAVGVRPGVSGPAVLRPEVESRIFQVSEATGRVEAKRGGKWVLVVAGDVLTQDDLVRTGVGRAILKLGGTTEIELRERVELRLDSISRAGASVDLRRGRVVATVGRAGSNVTVTAARTRTANQGGAPARFVVTADERGRVAVAATQGEAQFESAGRTVRLAAGTTSSAEPGQAPVDPEKISEDVFLNVTWPAGDRRGDRVAVSGRTTPGALVRVNGAPAEVDANGAFMAAVPVRVGGNSVEVEAEDAAGRSKVERREIRKIPTKAPLLSPVKTELWNQ